VIFFVGGDALQRKSDIAACRRILAVAEVMRRKVYVFFVTEGILAPGVLPEGPQIRVTPLAEGMGAIVRRLMAVSPPALVRARFPDDDQPLLVGGCMDATFVVTEEFLVVRRWGDPDHVKRLPLWPVRTHRPLRLFVSWDGQFVLLATTSNILVGRLNLNQPLRGWLAIHELRVEQDGEASLTYDDMAFHPYDAGRVAIATSEGILDGRIVMRSESQGMLKIRKLGPWGRGQGRPHAVRWAGAEVRGYELACVTEDGRLFVLTSERTAPGEALGGQGAAAMPVVTAAPSATERHVHWHLPTEQERAWHEAQDVRGHPLRVVAADFVHRFLVCVHFSRKVFCVVTRRSVSEWKLQVAVGRCLM
jgi:hypothetical protein